MTQPERQLREETDGFGPDREVPVEAEHELAPHDTAKALSPAARRALAEAAERRALYEARQRALAASREIDGRGGLDPVRYEDWEVRGIASDFS